MHCAVICLDTEGSGPLREEHMEAHIAHIKSISDKIMVAGPCPPDAEHENGASLFVLEVGNLAEARKIVEADPYNKAGIWQSIIVRDFVAAVGAWAPSQPVAAE